MSNLSLDTILDRLEREKQRATYGAVGALIGRIPRSVMQGRPKDARHSWVVSSDTLLPSDYAAHEMASDLLAHDAVLTSGDELRDWLGALEQPGR